MQKSDVQAIAIGTFDGVHKGHKKLISQLGEGGALVVIDSKKACLTPGRRREEYAGVGCFYYPLNDVKDLRGEEFIAHLTTDFPNLKRIVVGYDFKFGADRAWDKYDLVRIFKGQVVLVDEFSFDGLGVHSSAIRRFLRDGDIYRANRLMGREYSAAGVVIPGQGIASRQLYPTLNVDLGAYLAPADGVYATRTRIDEGTFCSITFVGRRLSTDGEFSVETHLLDMELENTPKEVRICFIERIRDNRKFSDLKELKQQITRDMAIAKNCSNCCDLCLDEETIHTRNIL